MVDESTLKQNLTEVYDASWELEYEGAVCKFELTSVEDAVLYDLEVPESMRNNGLGTDLIRFIEQYLRNNTTAEYMYVQIGAPTGATEHVLNNKLDFEITGVEKRETLGKVIDASKKL